MDDIKKQLPELHAALGKALEKVPLKQLYADIKSYKASMEDVAAFWASDRKQAEQITKKLAAAEQTVQFWGDLTAQLGEITELADLNDESFKDELEKQLAAYKKSFEQAKRELEFDGPYDNHDVILRIMAGAGGTDAQD